MPANNKLYQNFYKDKTIQRTDKFLVTIIENKLKPIDLNPKNNALNQQMISRAGSMPTIKEHDVANVTVPNFEFKKEIVNEGIFPRLFPVLSHEGFELSILFEDDAFGTIPKFINWCQRRIVDDNGIYYPFFLGNIGNLIFEALDDQDKIIYTYEFREIYFLRASPYTFDYTSTTAQKISITFGCDDSIFYIDENPNKNLPTL